MQILRTLRSTPDLLNQKRWRAGPGVCVLISSLCGSDVCSRLRTLAACTEVALPNVVESTQVFQWGWVLGKTSLRSWCLSQNLNVKKTHPWLQIEQRPCVGNKHGILQEQKKVGMAGIHSDHMVVNGLPKVNGRTNHLGILLMCRFWISRSGGGIEILHFSNSLAMMWVLVHWPCLQVGSKRVRFCSYEMQSNPKPLWVWFGFICLKFCDSFKTQLCHPLQPRSFAFWIPGLTSGTFSLLLPFI